ncbi:sulfatase-like hydrolase/transferase, partial [Persicitalea sp.]|uniref:sulfatase-like hydrolase/transferase n=1 Tax=Persicitalea sp. TaxID=3100273 RepID=UPI0035939063
MSVKTFPAILPSMRFLSLILLLFLSSFAFGQKQQPNVILILADDLGYGDVGYLNPDAKTKTPNIDALARSGMSFTNAHSPSAVCTPTRYALLTGRYSWRSRMKQGVLHGYSPPLIEQGRETMASMLQKKGYQTACVGKWHLGLDWQPKDAGGKVDKGGVYPDGSNVDFSKT